MANKSDIKTIAALISRTQKAVREDQQYAEAFKVEALETEARGESAREARASEQSFREAALTKQHELSGMWAVAAALGIDEQISVIVQERLTRGY